MNDTWWIKPDQLDDDQRKIITLPTNKSYLIKGPPGSGKTNLLLLRANYLVKSRYPNIIINVFTRNLKEFMLAGASEYAFSSDKIMTSCQWMLGICRDYGIDINMDCEFEELRNKLIVHTKKIFENHNNIPMFEVILLDESQDYLPEEIDLFKIASHRIFAIADSKQKIYSGQDSISILETIVHETIVLKYHYRNGHKICKLADGISKSNNKYDLLFPYSNYNEDLNPSSVEVFKCEDLEEQCKKIYEKLKLQLKAFPEEYIGILCPKKKYLRKVRDFFYNSTLSSMILAKSENDTYISFDNKPIVISSLHSAKGLEFRAVHIVAYDQIKKIPRERNLSYMSVTRSKTSLSIYYSGDLPGYFEQAYNNLYLPKSEPELDELF